ncbi:MAG TPA: transcription antitermination factor NusB [Thermoanaerobacterales bacterium]|nr:transcription antitermination factor NusB [Thermoanaerobacterales bacterium]
MNRKQARENVLKILFAIDVGGGDAEEVLNDFFSRINVNINLVKDRNIIYIKEIVEGTIENLEKIDSIIDEYSIDWKLDRLANVDKNILRFSIFEIIFREDIPYEVTINEAVEITKKYSSKESGKFVNGILGKVLTDIEKIKELFTTENP